jgi:hypothetical protein
VNDAEIAPSLAVSESRIGANGTTAEISNDCVTSVATVKFEVDPEEATSVHVPELTIVTESPDTVHTFAVWLVNTGVKPESTDGARVKAVVEKLRSAGSANVTSCARFATVIVTSFDVASL